MFSIGGGKHAERGASQRYQIDEVREKKKKKKK
jgi:hypothetical protein